MLTDIFILVLIAVKKGRTAARRKSHENFLYEYDGPRRDTDGESAEPAPMRV